MGSCASAHRESSSSMSAMKLRLSFRSKSDQVVSPASPFKDNTKGVNGDIPIKSQWSVSSPPPLSGASFRNLGSKDETFFDSQPWLESDCDDDFMSVNGEFTPSRGNTPVHQTFSAPSPRVNKPNLGNKTSLSTPETPSPTDKKKRLVELFRESGQDGQDDQYTMSSRGTPYVSGANSVCSSERTANGEPLVKEEKQTKSGQCCIPSLVSCKSFGDRKKKTTTTPPMVAVNGKP